MALVKYRVPWGGEMDGCVGTGSSGGVILSFVVMQKQELAEKSTRQSVISI